MTEPMLCLIAGGVFAAAIVTAIFLYLDASERRELLARKSENDQMRRQLDE